MRTFRSTRTSLLVGALAFALPVAGSFGVLAQDPAPEAPPTPAPAPAAPAAAPIAFKSLVVYPPAIKISAANDLQHISAAAGAAGAGAGVGGASGAGSWANTPKD
ncbi:MAG: hypothetical protein ACKN82_07530, partial [Pirellula sp.]